MKKIILLFVLVLSALISENLSANISQPNVTVSPSQANNYGKYTISSTTGNGTTDLTANTDTIFVEFNSSTVVPDDITSTNITVNNTASNYVEVYQTSPKIIAILTPVNIAKNGGAFTVVITTSAQVTNPDVAVATNFTLRVRTNKGVDVAWVTSAQYTITTSSSSVSQAAVTPNPSVENLAASYRVSFNVGSGGALTTANTITILFDSFTTIPDGALEGVTMNGTPATAVSNNDTIVINCPVPVSAEGSVTIDFSVGSGIINPSFGNYTLRVRTSKEKDFVTSAVYTITTNTQLSITAVTVTPSTVNANASYQLDFYTSSTGGMTAGLDTIIFIFQPNTYIPVNFASNAVTITSGGYSDNPVSIHVDRAVSTDPDTVYFITPVNIANSSNVNVNITSTAGLLNPSIAGNYTLKMRTSKDMAGVNSSTFAITNTSTTVSNANVTPTSTAVSAVTSYKVEFNLGANGRLYPGSSAITLSFSSGYTLSTLKSRYDTTRISVGGGAFVKIDTNNITINNTEKTIQLIVPSNVITDNNSNIVIWIAGQTTQPITNPAAANNYQLGVKTSVEPTNVLSNTYNIGGTSVTITGITLSNSTVNNFSTYTFSFTGSSVNGSTPDDIYVIFPEGTVLPATITAGNVTLNGGANIQTVTVNTTTRMITLRPTTGNKNSPFTLVIGSTTAVIRNPVVPSATFYKYTIYTSQNLAPVTSNAVSITGHATTVTGVSATSTPSVINYIHPQYAVNFTTTGTGKIAGGTAAGSSWIDITFGHKTKVPSFITPSTVKVNSNDCQSVTVLTSGDSGKVRVVVPSGLTIDNNAQATVVFDTSSGLINNGIAGNSTVTVKTSSDTLNGTGTYTISLTQDLAFTSLSPTPSTINAKASYSIKFITGSSGDLSQNDTIYIKFPYNTYVPPTISKNDITINGMNLLTNPVVINDTIKMNVPQVLGISALKNVTVLINSTAGILNPTLVASNYVVRLRTQSEPAIVTSPTYSTTATSTTIYPANVYPGDQRVSSPVNIYTWYRIALQTGPNGRLYPGTSSVSVTFNTPTGVGQTVSEYDSVYMYANGLWANVPTSDITINTKTLTFKVPAALTVNNNDFVEIIINRTTLQDPLRNPTSAGYYTVDVYTSVETTPVKSNEYVITNQPAVTNIRVIVNPDTVNAVSADSIRFTVGASGALTANNNTTGRIIITFPNNTFIPVTIPTTAIRVASQTNNTFTNAFAVSTNPSQRSITITTPVTVSNNDSVRVAILTSAGIQNPSVTGSYTLQVSTHAQPLNGTSQSYLLKPTITTISDVSLSISPIDLGGLGRYVWSFKTGSRGRLLSGTSTIIMIFPYNATFTQGVPATSKVTINSVSAAALQLKEGTLTNPDTLVATLPSSVTVGNLSDVTVIIDSSAGLQNVTFATPQTYQIYTSVEPYAIGYDVSLPVVLSYFRASQESESVVLNWRTESEIDNAFWLIQKAEVNDPDNDNSSLSYSTITTLKGQGTTTTATDYIWSDSEIKPDRTYAYRIVDVAYNGAMTYHEPQKITVTGPKQFALYQNYPNPFNPVTTIKYQLPYDSKVTITIYNVLGQKVMELIDREQAQGFYTLTWNGRNDRLSAVASGLYIYRIKAKPLNGRKEWTATKKMLLLK